MRVASSPWAIASSCSVNSMSPTQWNSQRHLALVARRPVPARRLWLVRSQCRNSTALPTVADSSSVRTCSGSSPSDSSQTMPRSGSLKLWNSSITTALTWLKSKAAAKGLAEMGTVPHCRNGRRVLRTIGDCPLCRPSVDSFRRAAGGSAGFRPRPPARGRRGFRGGCRSPGPRRSGSKPQRTAADCISRNFCSHRAISGVV